MKSLRCPDARSFSSMRRGTLAPGHARPLSGIAGLALLDLRRYERSTLLLVGLIIGGTAIYALYGSFLRSGTYSRRRRKRRLPWMGALIGAGSGSSSAGAGALFRPQGGWGPALAPDVGRCLKLNTASITTVPMAPTMPRKG
jgi:hypothetical protein